MIKMFLGLFLVSSAFAAGGSGHISDLMWPAVNFVVLFTFLGIKLKKPMQEHFAGNSKTVKEIYEIAEKKDKEAQIKLESYQKKLSDFNKESEKIVNETQKEINQAISSIEIETKSMIEKLNEDAVAKIENEKKTLLNELNTSLVNEVIRKTKDRVKSDSSLNGKVTNKLSSQV